MLARFRSLNAPAPVAKAPVAKAPKAPRVKWHWVVMFADGSSVNIPVARGVKDARLQAHWIVKERTGSWPAYAIVEVQKRPTGSNGMVYLSYRRRR